jgi:hypothetical protein
MMFVRQATCQNEVIMVSEDLPPRVTSDAAADPDADIRAGLDGARLAGTIAGRVADQARLTAGAAKARRVVNTDGEPGVLDVTPLRELLSELAAELGKMGLREQIARVLRQAADAIDPPAGDH